MIRRAFHNWLNADSVTRDDFQPRIVVIAGMRVTAALFMVGMAGILYGVLAESRWALFWWLFTAITMPACAYYFYHETRHFYILHRDGNDWSALPRTYAYVAACAGLAILVILALYLYPY